MADIKQAAVWLMTREASTVKRQNRNIQIWRDGEGGLQVNIQVELYDLLAEDWEVYET